MPRQRDKIDNLYYIVRLSDVIQLLRGKYNFISTVCLNIINS